MATDSDQPAGRICPTHHLPTADGERCLKCCLAVIPEQMRDPRDEEAVLRFLGVLDPDDDWLVDHHGLLARGLASGDPAIQRGALAELREFLPCPCDIKASVWYADCDTPADVMHATARLLDQMGRPCPINNRSEHDAQIRAQAIQALEEHAKLLDQGLGAVTTAIRICGSCNRFLGREEWRGAEAHAGKPSVVTHGYCQACFEALDFDDEAKREGWNGDAA